jgi:hypothetical protein
MQDVVEESTKYANTKPRLTAAKVEVAEALTNSTAATNVIVGHFGRRVG